MTAVSEIALSPKIREVLRPYHERPVVRSVATLALDYSLYLGLSVCGILSHILLVKVVAGMLAGMLMGRLFVIGHDACHGSFSRSRRLNRIAGTLAFLPTLTSFSAWEIGHNRTHHAYTNLATHDHVWSPFSKEAYDALPLWRRRLERVYRMPLGHGLYYFIEDWGKNYFFKRTPSAGYRDFALIAGVAIAVAAGTSVVAYATGQNIALVLICSMLIPFVNWNISMGFIIFQQHTSPDIRWYNDVAAWRQSNSEIDGIQRVLFLGPINVLFHSIMEHHAHHADPFISLHELARAQEALERNFPGRVQVVPWTLKGFLNATRVCKLYDYNEHRWRDFDGTYTTERIG